MTVTNGGKERLANIELDDKYFEVASKRIADAEQSQMSLFKVFLIGGLRRWLLTLWTW